MREAYGEWLLALEWHSFATFTFRQPRSTRRAGEIFRTFLDAGTGGCGEYFACSVVVWGSEPHKSGAGHLHALLRWHPWCGLRAEAFTMSAEWRTRYGRVEMARYDPTRGAAYYLTKYVLKDAAGSGEWDVWKEGGSNEPREVWERPVVGTPGADVTPGEAQGWQSSEERDRRLDEESFYEEAVRRWEETSEEARF